MNNDDEMLELEKMRKIFNFRNCIILNTILIMIILLFNCTLVGVFVALMLMALNALIVFIWIAFKNFNKNIDDKILKIKNSESYRKYPEFYSSRIQSLEDKKKNV